ncbi:hypothetical protein ACLKA7_000214 [Drosophila subpalustris]
MNLQPRTPGGENDNEDAVFGRRKALARTPPPSAPPASNGTSVFNFGADGNDVQKSHSDPLDMLKCLGIRARELVKRMNDKRHIDIPMKELAMKVVALQALVLKNLEKDQCSSTGVTSTGTQTSPGPANSGAKRLRESPQVSTRNSPPKKQKGARQKQPTNLINIPDQRNDESTPTVTVDRSATPAAKKQLQWQQVGPKAIKKKAQREPRPDAIIIQPQENLSYSDILRLVTRRQDNKLKEMSGPRADITKTLLQVPGVWSPGKSVYEYRGPHWTLSQVRAIVGELFPRMNDDIDSASYLQLEQQDNSALAEVSPEEESAGSGLNQKQCPEACPLTSP